MWSALASALMIPEDESVVFDASDPEPTLHVALKTQRCDVDQSCSYPVLLKAEELGLELVAPVSLFYWQTRALSRKLTRL